MKHALLGILKIVPFQTLEKTAHSSINDLKIVVSFFCLRNRCSMPILYVLVISVFQIAQIAQNEAEPITEANGEERDRRCHGIRDWLTSSNHFVMYQRCLPTHHRRRRCIGECFLGYVFFMQIWDISSFSSWLLQLAHRSFYCKMPWLPYNAKLQLIIQEFGVKISVFITCKAFL